MDPFEFLVENGVAPGDLAGLTPELAQAKADELLRKKRGLAPGAIMSPEAPISVVPEQDPAAQTPDQLLEGLRAAPGKALDAVAGVAKQVPAGVAEIAGRTPYDMLAALTSIPEGAGRFLNMKRRELMDLPPLEEGFSPTKELQRLGQGVTHTVDEIFGAPENYAEKMSRAGLGAPLVAATDAVRELVIPDEPQMIEAAAGPTKTTAEEWGVLGLLGALSIGAAMVPGTRGALHLGLPNPRRVLDAHPKTLGLSTREDLLHVYHDANAGLKRIMERAGVPQQVFDTVFNALDVHTRGAATSLGDSAVKLGNAVTTGRQFRVPKSVYTLQRDSSPELEEFIRLHDRLDELQLPRNLRINPNNPNVAAAVFNATTNRPPRRRVQGQNEQHVLARINQLAAQTPELRNLHKAYLENLKEWRRFESEGEFATMAPRKRRELELTHKNSVPDARKTFGEAVVEQSPFMVLAQSIKTGIQRRLENEARGLYIDAIRQVNPRYARRVSERQLKDNPRWRENTVTVYRRGKKEYYNTDPLIAGSMRFDPYLLSNFDVFNTGKRLFEASTTGALAPWFSVTSAIRGYRQGAVNAPTGRKGPGVFSTIAAPAEQVIPQMAKAMAGSLTRNAPLLEKVFDPATISGVATNLARVFDQSLFRQLAVRGTVNATFMTKQRQNATSRLGQAAASGTTPFHAFLNGYKALITAIHSAPQYSMVKRNYKDIGIDEAIKIARKVSGDPRVTGQFFGPGWTPLRSNARHNTAPQIVGAMSELGRRYIPWWNIMNQSMKSIGKAYLANPNRFVQRAWLYGGLPAAAGYLYNRALSETPEAKERGWDYSYYQNHGRSLWSTLMEDYLGVFGKPPEDGITIPRFHELSIMSRLVEVGLDHLFRASPFTAGEDFLSAASGFVDVGVEPPMPTPMAFGIATTGQNPPMGIFGQEAYEPQREPFVNDQWPVSLETISRAIGGGMAGVLGDAAAAFTSDNEADLAERFGASLREAGSGMVKRTPILRDLMGLRFPRSSNTQIAGELFETQSNLNDLTGYFKQWGENDGAVTMMNRTTPAGAAATRRLGTIADTPDDYTGVMPPAPTNPLYLAFMEQIYNNFATDTKGDMNGFKKMWEAHGDMTQKIKPLQRINEGNLGSWREEMEQRGDEIRYLKGKGVDYRDPRAVRNWYVQERQKVQLKLLDFIHEAEANMTADIKKVKELVASGADPYELDLTPQQLNLLVLMSQGVEIPDTISLKTLNPNK